jgi:hypothetical protein
VEKKVERKKEIRKNEERVEERERVKDITFAAVGRISGLN